MLVSKKKLGCPQAKAQATRAFADYAAPFARPQATARLPASAQHSRMRRSGGQVAWRLCSGLLRPTVPTSFAFGMGPATAAVTCRLPVLAEACAGSRGFAGSATQQRMGGILMPVLRQGLPRITHEVRKQ